MLAMVLCIRTRPPFFRWKKWSVFRFFKAKCDSCKDWDHLYKNVERSFPIQERIQFFDIDCSKYRDFCCRYDIVGVPSMFITNSGFYNSSKYIGKKSSERISSFITKATGIQKIPPKSVVHGSIIDIVESISTGKCTIVVFFKKLLPKYIENALDLFIDNEEISMYSIDIESNRFIAQSLKIVEAPSIYISSLSKNITIDFPNTTIELYSTINSLCFGSDRANLRRFIRSIVDGLPVEYIPDIFENVWNLTSFRSFLYQYTSVKKYLLKDTIRQLRKEIIHPLLKGIIDSLHLKALVLLSELDE